MYTLIEILLGLGVLGTLVTVISACVCGCRNSNQKASTQNSQRSLPEIPHPVGRHDSGDTASEIYATVNLDEANKVAATTSRDHPYEHAYAKLQNESHNITVEITTDENSEVEIQIDEREATPSAAVLISESVPISASVAISGQLPSSQELPYITPPSPRPNPEPAVHFSGDSTDSAKGYTSISVREPLSNIRAQTIKPSQPHYATVSDDSDEMYAAIEEASVGEGSDTYAQIPDPRTRRTTTQAIVQQPPSDNTHTHEVTVHARRSAPPEVGASTSHGTHSRQASMSSCSNSAGALGSPKPEKRQANSPLPPPPQAHDPKHHRINSASDLHFNHDKLRRSLNEKHQRNNSCVSSSDFYGCNYPVEKHRFSSGDLIRPLVAKELNFDIDQKEQADNLYNSIEGPNLSDYSSADANTSINSERATESPSRNVEEMYAKVIKKTKTKEETIKVKDSNEEKLKFRGDDPGYETIDRKQSSHGYETISRKRKSQTQDPGYETVKEMHIGQNFTNNNLKQHLVSDSGPNSIISNDAGYELIAKTDNNASDSDPNYEVLRNNPPTPPYATISSNYKVQATYSTVNKRTGKYSGLPNNNEPSVEPNYESVTNDPIYTTGSESDPNYESVRPKEPNYESLRGKDPKYESVRSKNSRHDSVRSKNDPNYESVKYFELSKKEPPYEKVDMGENSGIERSDSSAGYERINISNIREPKSINNSDCTVSDYFQV
ncbi:unnamed protein product [Pieris brassicae]|uniref:Uncharacterized protein n=1 Tax=Pieris brassicae TaxID=7116 RepID=A0A9P0T242_PIEBR|nr:unnamed protein product [Pieris brassicae]